MDSKKEERQSSLFQHDLVHSSQKEGHNRQQFIELMVHIGTALRTCNSLELLDVARFIKEGYSQAEVSAALSWLIDKITLETGNLTLPYNNFPAARIFNENESVRITMPAQEYLLQLRQLRIISQYEFERIVDTILQTATAPMLELDSIKGTAITIIFANADANNPGSRLMLNMNDSIQ